MTFAPMKIAIVGCGFVADLYMATLADHPSLQVTAAMDIVPAHADRFAAHWRVPVFYDAASLLAGAEFEMVLNLTNPESHVEVSRTFLEQGRHVYSEKPFTLKVEDGQALADLAARKGVQIAAAPCLHLGEMVHTLRREIEAGRIGKPLLAYAEMNDDLVGRSTYRQWRGVSGAPWPAEDEFHVGVTLEHIGYSLGALMAVFGPVKRLVSFASLLYPGKPVPPGLAEGQDFSLACLEFESGPVARLTCSNISPRDHSVTVFGEDGVMRAEDCWRFATPVTARGFMRLRNRFMLTPWSRRMKTVPTGPQTKVRGAGAMDFARGPAALALSVRSGAPSLMPIDFALHVNEVSLAVHDSVRPGAPAEYTPRTRFAPLRPVTTPIV